MDPPSNGLVLKVEETGRRKLLQQRRDGRNGREICWLVGQKVVYKFSTSVQETELRMMVPEAGMNTSTYLESFRFSWAHGRKRKELGDTQE